MTAGFGALGDDDIHPCGNLPDGVFAGTDEGGARYAVAAGAFEHRGRGNP